MDELLADFVTETNENLAKLDVALLRLERVPADAATLSLIFRMVHTIKGTCGFLGLPRLEQVAHAAENLLDQLRDGAVRASSDTVNQILMALDRIKTILAGLSQSGTEPAGDDIMLISQLNATASGQPPPRKERPAVLAPFPQRHPGALLETAAEQRRGTPIAAAQTIRVAVDALENLMTLVAELVLTRDQLLRLNRTECDSGFTAHLRRLSHITSNLREGVMKIHMQPVGNAWGMLPRLVRDLARDLDKKIELTTLGADIELDRRVLELIKDPLTHMVRNSGDHGLESPTERRAAGKPETGRIMLNAYHAGGYMIIEISDDGRGLSTGTLRAKILADGLATEAELAIMTEAQIHRFIFHAGFSTAVNVTSVSGRGVGLDVVKTNIEKTGGTVDLESIAGQGTTFILRIPLAGAIVAAVSDEAAPFSIRPRAALAKV